MPPLSSDPKALPSLTISPDVLEALQTQQAPTPSLHLPLLHVLTLGMVSRPRIWVSFGTPLLASTRHRSLDGSHSLPLLYAYDCPLLQVHIFHQYHSHGSSLLPRLPHLQIPAPTPSSQLSHQNMLKTLTVTTVFPTEDLHLKLSGLRMCHSLRWEFQLPQTSRPPSPGELSSWGVVWASFPLVFPTANSQTCSQVSIHVFGPAVEQRLLPNLVTFAID